MIDILHKLGLPINMSVQGAAIDEINAIVHWLMLILFVGWGLFFIVSLVKFRASKNAKADYTGVKSHLSSLLEAVVAVIEIVILFGFGFPIWAARVTDVPSTYESVHLRVVAQQFAWNFHYPGPDGKFGKTRADLVDEQENPVGLDRSSDNASDDFYTVNQLHVPVNKKIRIDLTSLDVIHSFTLPELRVKQDAIPGMVIPVHFTATMTSNEFLKTTIGTKREGKSLEVTCAQLCGLGHYRMRGFFTVHDDDGYQSWLDEQAEYLEEESGDDDWGDDDW
ncbi:MAG TPA: cytochrome c oxidase subunit II [Candidatus Marinimicrobia bacterium]|nr:cytochrome c oxidase subunit II [Candidatus Neomarinimicrobiota bacterium]